MAKYSRKVAAALRERQREFDQRNQLAAQVSGGTKVVPMLNKPGSQNRKKGWGGGRSVR